MGRKSSQANRSKTDDRSCVIVVGSTGTGKSSTIAKVTGLQVSPGALVNHRDCSYRLLRELPVKDWLLIYALPYSWE